MKDHIIPIIQIILSVGIICLILMQERSSGLSSIFGGGGGSPYQARRGFEKMTFIGTILLVIAFTSLAVAQLIFH